MTSLDTPEKPTEATVRAAIAGGDIDSVIAQIHSLVDIERAAAANAALAAAAAAVPAVPVLPEASLPPHVSGADHTASVFKPPEAPKPEAFSGDPRKPPLVDTWIFHINRYFENWPALTDYHKLRLATQYLKGSALLWFQHESQSSGRADPFSSWVDFELALKKAFHDVNFVDRARHELSLLRQTGSVRGYLDTFKSICFRIPADQLLDAEKKQRFIEGLKPYVRSQVLLKFPDSFSAAAEMADQVDRVSYDYKFMYTAPRQFQLRPQAPGPRGIQTGSSSTTSSAPAPMEIGTIQNQSATAAAAQTSERSQRAPFKPLSPAQRRFLATHDGCFYCRKANAGHIAQNCPLKKKQQQANQSNTRAQ
jgi:hypothetical protein